MQRCLRVGTYQGQPEKSNIARNIQTLADIIDAARMQQLDLVLFPELYLTGYDMEVEAFQALALYVDGDDIKKIQDIALSSGISIGVGYPEKCRKTNKIYNSCVLIDGFGSVTFNYRKTHLWDPTFSFEKIIFTPGESLDICELNIRRTGETYRLGILICFDSEFCEPARVLTLKGAEIILIPTALAEGSVADLVPTITIPTRALENHVFIIYSNLIGSCELPSKENCAFCGQSGIIAPDGTDLVRASKLDCGLFVSELNRAEFEDSVVRNDYIANRRPELYGTKI
jgi:predicted amidohydrolase